MSEEMKRWSLDRMVELARRHADLETRRELDPLMDTLVPEPRYEFHPIGLGMSGGDRVRRYYEQFFSDFMQKIVGYELLEECASESAVIQEYAITVEVEGERATHRVVGILFAEGELLGGERLYGSEAPFRLMAGKIFEELEPL